MDQNKKLDFSAFDLRKFDMTRKYDDDFSSADGIRWRDHVLLYSVAGLMIFFVLWASFAALDEVSRGEGKVIPSSEVQIIQTLEGGIIDAFLVKEGDKVERGQVILRMRNIQAKADLGGARQQYLGLLATVTRLQAQVDRKVLKFPAEVIKGAPASVKAERAAFVATRKQFDSQIAILKEQKSQKIQEVTELKKRIIDITSVLRLAQDERAMVLPMVGRGAASKQELLQLDRQIATQNTDLNGLKLAMPRSQTAVKESQRRIDEQVNTMKANAQRELAEKTIELSSIRETLAAFQDKSARTEVRSPVTGTVKDLKVNTVGGVVRGGEAIMEIVPLEDQLIIEARIRPADIAFIYPGQRAIVRLTAFDFSIYGAIESEVVDISADTITNEKGESFYRVKVRTNETTLTRRGKTFKIIPGMQATVDIVTGRKTVMNYLMKPFVKASQTALRER